MKADVLWGIDRAKKSTKKTTYSLSKKQELFLKWIITYRKSKKESKYIQPNELSYKYNAKRTHTEFCQNIISSNFYDETDKRVLNKEIRPYYKHAWLLSTKVENNDPLTVIINDNLKFIATFDKHKWVRCNKPHNELHVNNVLEAKLGENGNVSYKSYANKKYTYLNIDPDRHVRMATENEAEQLTDYEINAMDKASTYSRKEKWTDNWNISI